jgi:heptaprenylglyceryl phosphate synthase
MISIVFGAISLFVGGGDPATILALLMAFAIVFVTGSVFFEVRGADWGCIAVSLIFYLQRSV